MSLDSSIDPDIAAAFSGQTPGISQGNVDPDIAAAFSATDSGDKGSAPKGLDNLVNAAHEFGSSAYHSLVGGYKGLLAPPGQAADAVNQELAKTYHAPPQTLTPAQQKVMQMPSPTALGDFAEAHGAPPSLSTALAVLPTAAASGLVPRGAGGATEASAYADPQSMGAAHAGVDFSKAEPDIQAAFDKLSPADIEANRSALERHAEAQSLQVPMRLTEGQATGDPDTISNELNNRAATGLSKVLNAQGQQLKDNLQAMRENVGPDVFSTNSVEHGQALIDAYKAKDAPIQADINSKYQALRDAAGGEIPIDGQAFVSNARNALRKQLLSNDVPSSIKSDLDSFGTGEPMNFEDFESMRSKLAQEMRDNPSGNARKAAGIVRSSLEDLPLQGGAESLKPLADAARGAAKARFSALESDPAYDAAVNDKVAPDQFVNKFVTGVSGSATKAQAAAMRSSLADNPTALQTMGVATVDELKKAALGPSGEGNFGQARYSNRLESLRPKLNDLLPADQIEQATNLGNVARYMKQRPEGATVNESNTLSGAIASKMGETAKSIANVKTGGLAGPLIDFAQTKFREGALRSQLEAATAPLAGVRPAAKGPTLQ